MKNVIDFDLEYRVDGKPSIHTFRIDFISNWCVREYNKILSYIFDVQKKWDRLNSIISETTALRIEKPEGYKNLIQSKEDESKQIYADLSKYSDMHAEKERFNLIKQILIDNGYTDERFLDFDFWDKNVSPADANLFLEKCVWKDIDKKKRQ